MKLQKMKERIYGKAPKHSTSRKIQAGALVSAFAMLCINGIRVYDFIIDPHNTGLPLSITLALLLFFLIIWRLARNGHTIISAWLIIAAYALPTIYCFYLWGADLPAGILMSVLVVVMAGMFLGPRPAFLVTIIFEAATITLTYLQYYGVLNIISNWRTKPNQPADALTYLLIIGTIYMLARIIIRENKRALREANAARIDLQRERDGLELTVIERTKAITQMQREKIEQLQTLANIGKLSSGIFHDIVNPLTAVGLNLEQLKKERCPELIVSQDYLQQALSATSRIKDLVGSANSSLRRQNPDISFSVRSEINKVKLIMDAKARAQNTAILIDAGPDIHMKGGPTRFGQVIMNLLANALDACAGLPPDKTKEIKISLRQSGLKEKVCLIIADSGAGICAENLNKIFNAFFTTKDNTNTNLGLGLSVVKEIIETDFKGDIEVSSEPEKGSIFTICLPTNL